MSGWDDARCEGCQAPLDSYEWVVRGVAHEDSYCWGDDMPDDTRILCWACVDRAALPRCERCHIRWANGALMRPDDAIVFA